MTTTDKHPYSQDLRSKATDPHAGKSWKVRWHNCHGKINFATTKSILRTAQSISQYGKISFAHGTINFTIRQNQFYTRHNQFHSRQNNFHSRQNKFYHDKLILATWHWLANCYGSQSNMAEFLVVSRIMYCSNCGNSVFPTAHFCVQSGQGKP